jgi:hypothetical protein
VAPVRGVMVEVVCLDLAGCLEGSSNTQTPRVQFDRGLTTRRRMTQSYLWRTQPRQRLAATQGSQRPKHTSACICSVKGAWLRRAFAGIASHLFV